MSSDDGLMASGWYRRQTPALQRALMAAGRTVALAPGQLVYDEGDDETGLVAVLDGALRLEASASADRLVLIGIARRGSIFGQSRRRGGGPRIVTARAGRASRVMLVSDTALDRIAGQLPETWQAVSELVYGQLDAAVHGTALLLGLAPRARIAARLLPLAEDGQALIAQVDLAELCGLSRKSANAHLSALETAGAIRRGYGVIEIVDAARLRGYMR